MMHPENGLISREHGARFVLEAHFGGIVRAVASHITIRPVESEPRQVFILENVIYPPQNLCIAKRGPSKHSIYV
jgi:hypothetical protein